MSEVKSVFVFQKAIAVIFLKSTYTLSFLGFSSRIQPVFCSLWLVVEHFKVSVFNAVYETNELSICDDCCTSGITYHQVSVRVAVVSVRLLYLLKAFK